MKNSTTNNGDFTLILTIHDGSEILATRTCLSEIEKENAIEEWGKNRIFKKIGSSAIIIRNGIFESQIFFK